MQFNPNEIVQLFVSVQSLLFAVILLTDKNKKRRVNYFLAAFLLMLALQMAFILSEKWVQDYSSFASYLCIFGFAYGPLLYFYTLNLSFNDFKQRKAHLLHALPFLIMLLSGLLGFGLCNYGSLLYVSLIAYVSLSVRHILSYRKLVKNTHSTIDRINLSWLQWTMIIFTVILLTDIYTHFYNELEPIPGVSIVSISLLILINGMFYKGLKQPQVFEGISQMESTLVLTDTSSEENPFPEEAKRIKDYFKGHQPYTDADLTLAQLATKLDMPSRRLSEVINRHFRQNFMDFINSHRIEYATERLRNPLDPKETIMEVMYDVGFNSKSSFNTIFKQKTGKTPSEYKRSIR
ncbi:MAG: AraC family transcriptional regulator [Roseivirga sp.]|nr:AraC family transcriptional regulator [Roseivirga sp.]